MTTTYPFQAEVSQVLHLVIHSLYSHKEIFLRELVSNASDALDKLRFRALTEPDLSRATPTLAIRIRADREKRTLTIEDTGVGMTEEELVRDLGTVARSGSRAFLEQLAQRGQEGRAPHRPVRRRLLQRVPRGRPGRGRLARGRRRAAGAPLGRPTGRTRFTGRARPSAPTRGTRDHASPHATTRRSSSTTGACATSSSATRTTSATRSSSSCTKAKR